MRLVIIRHGIAEDFGPDGTDASRRLTPEGVEKTGKVAHGLKAIAKQPDIILSSPKARALHTARIIADVFQAPLEVRDIIQEEDPIALLQMVAGCKHESVFLVGHEPTLGALVESLIAGHFQRGATPMKKAGAASFEIYFSGQLKNPAAQLKWFLPPDILTRL